MLYLQNDDYQFTMSQSIIYGLRTLNGTPQLDYSIGLKIILDTPTELQIDLPNGIVTLNKYVYLNKDKVFDNGDLFFMIANKQVKSEYIFKKLLEYAMRKIETRIDHLHNLKNSYSKLVAA